MSFDECLRRVIGGRSKGDRYAKRAKDAAHVISKLVNLDGKPKHWLWKLQPDLFSDFADPYWPELIELPTGRRGRKKDAGAEKG